jgi:peptidoglycan/xylan/chitin deacetylase (PgdA/CDA1 family)
LTATVLSRSAGAVVPRLARVRAGAAAAGLVVVYHRVGDPPGDPRVQLSPALASSLLEDQVRYLHSRFNLVRADELLDTLAARRRGARLPLAITFDDDLLSHHGIAAPILDALGVPATFFVGGTFVGSERWSWWELVDLLSGHGMDVAELSALAGVGAAGDVHAMALAVERLPAGERDAATLRLWHAAGAPPPPPRLRASELRDLARRGHEIGFHTIRHDALPALDDAALAVALRVGCDRLHRITGTSPTTIAYPHGKADARVVQAARAAGWSAGFTTAPGAIDTASDPLALGRLDAPFTSVPDLARRLAVLVALHGR